MADLITDIDNPRSGRHRELEKAEISKSEQAVVRVIDAVKNFTNPFMIADKERLYCLASGAPVPLDVETIDKDAKGDFVDVLKNGEAGSFFFPIKKKKLKTLETSNKNVTLMSSQGKGVCNVLVTFITF